MTTLTTADIATETITLNRGIVKQFCTAARKALRLPGKSFCAARCAISQSPDGVVLYATSGRGEISLEIDSQPGDCLRITLQGDELASLAGTRKESAVVAISHSRYGATITWKSGSASCEMFARAEPESVEIDNTATWPVPGLVDAIHRAESCCDLESTRYALSGYLLTAEDGQPTDIVATDARQLLQQHGVIPADTIHQPAIVPAIGLRSIFGRRFDDLEIGQDEYGRIVFAGDGWRIRLESVDGIFPRYTDVIRHADDDDTVLTLADGDPQRDSEWDTKTDNDTEIQIQLNGSLQTVEGDYTYTFHRETTYTGSQADVTMRQRYWNRGTSIQPESIGFRGDYAVIFRSPEITYLAMPLCK